MGFVQYITTHSYHSVIEVRIAIQVYGDCSPHSNSLVVVLLSRAKRLSPAPVFFLRLRDQIRVRVKVSFSVIDIIVSDTSKTAN